MFLSLLMMWEWDFFFPPVNYKHCLSQMSLFIVMSQQKNNNVCVTQSPGDASSLNRRYPELAVDTVWCAGTMDSIFQMLQQRKIGINRWIICSITFQSVYCRNHEFIPNKIPFNSVCVMTKQGETGIKTKPTILLLQLTIKHLNSPLRIKQDRTL